MKLPDDLQAILFFSMLGATFAFVIACVYGHIDSERIRRRMKNNE